MFMNTFVDKHLALNLALILTCVKSGSGKLDACRKRRLGLWLGMWSWRINPGQCERSITLSFHCIWVFFFCKMHFFFFFCSCDLYSGATFNPESTVCRFGKLNGFCTRQHRGLTMVCSHTGHWPQCHWKKSSWLRDRENVYGGKFTSGFQTSSVLPLTAPEKCFHTHINHKLIWTSLNNIFFLLSDFIGSVNQ